jgi:hypothetical protein
VATSFPDRRAEKETQLGFDEIASPLIPIGESFLPSSAAPCVDFSQASAPSPVYDVFGGPSDWTESDRRRLESFLMIGSDGAGNPICIEAGSGQIWLLDHEDRFQTRTFVNSSVSQLAECLLAYMGETDPESFKAALDRIDPSALEHAAFWSYELLQLEQEST